LLGLGFWAWHIGAVGASLLGPELFFDNFKYNIFGMLCFGSSPNLAALERIKKKISVGKFYSFSTADYYQLTIFFERVFS
jgi:hypothetical protein